MSMAAFSTSRAQIDGCICGTVTMTIYQAKLILDYLTKKKDNVCNSVLV